MAVLMRIIFQACFLLCLGAATSLSALPATTNLGIRDTFFTLNGQDTFLYGISYYGGLGAPEEFLQKDFADMQRYRFNWLRVWATWSSGSNDVSAVDAEGSPREPFLSRLKHLVAECDRRGLAVDITLSRGKGLTGPARLQTFAAHQQAVETLVLALKPWRNWYLDLSNERNIRDARFTSIEDLARLRALVRKLDPARLVTASDGGDISLDDLHTYLRDAELDFVCQHRPRDPVSPAQTASKTAQYLEWMKIVGRVVPLHYQEPFRRGYAKWQPKAPDFITDARTAYSSGAAGWCFHNGEERGDPNGPKRCFDLRDKRLFDQLDAEEFKALENIRALRASGNF